VIYGSFAALPLFLVWMQVNFMILLFGAEIAAHIEGDRYFRKNTESDSFKLVNQKQLSFMILHEITSRFLKGKKPLSINHISENLGVSSLDARGALNILERAGIISEIRSSERYQLTINPDLFTIQSVNELLEKTASKKIFSKETIPLHTVSNCFSQFEHSIKNSTDNLNLREFAILKDTKDVL
jgi:membrane protein